MAGEIVLLECGGGEGGLGVEESCQLSNKGFTLNMELILSYYNLDAFKSGRNTFPRSSSIWFLSRCSSSEGVGGGCVKEAYCE